MSGCWPRTPSEHVARLELRPVGARVGDVRNDGRDLLDRVPAPACDQAMWSRSI